MDRRLMQALGIWSALATVLFVIGGLVYGTWYLDYLMWNLALALIPVGLTHLLMERVRRGGWRRLATWVVAVAWLGFLPNSFYVITDVMHLADTETGLPLLFGAVVFWWFGFVGMMAGALSLGTVHQELRRRLPAVTAYGVVGAILALVSVGMYLGRVERWNTWDVLLNPAGLLLTVVDGFSRPEVMVVLMYFVVLGGFYAGMWSIKSIFKN